MPERTVTRPPHHPRAAGPGVVAPVAPPPPASHRTAPTPKRALVVAMLLCYLALLVWVVVWKLEAPHVGDGGRVPIKLVPFAATAEYGASAPREVLANLLLFAPLGVYLGLLSPRGALLRVLLVAAATSLALETAQYALAVGSADTTDIIVNTAGGVVGLALVIVARRTLGARAGAGLTRWCLVGTAVAAVACVAVFVSPLHSAQRDVTVRADTPLVTGPDEIAR